MSGRIRFESYSQKCKEICLDLFASNIPQFFAEKEAKDYSDFLDQFGDRNYWLMYRDLQPVGCGGIAHEGDGLYSLCYGMIHNKIHRQGLGKALIKYRIQRILELGDVKKIRLETMQINPGFFEKFGFVIESHDPNYYADGIDKIEMSLQLRSEHQRQQLFALLESQ